MPRSTRTLASSKAAATTWNLSATSSCTSSVAPSPGRASRPTPRSKSTSASWTARCRPRPNSCARATRPNSAPTLNTAAPSASRTGPITPTSSASSRSCSTARASSTTTCSTGRSSTCSRRRPACRPSDPSSLPPSPARREAPPPNSSSALWTTTAPAEVIRSSRFMHRSTAAATAACRTINRTASHTTRPPAVKGPGLGVGGIAIRAPRNDRRIIRAEDNTVPYRAPTRQEAMMMLADIGQGPERSENAAT
mmetsp:Transcript_21450/g.50632  ORF Transcript_21450/g.50632 Transcript_21450/m.50632 type:complete len:252 (-) Transcript_21450:108-863(-)